MAKRYKNPTFGKPRWVVIESTGGPNWASWTDGGVWEIRKGDDYEIPTEEMREATRAEAERRRVRLIHLNIFEEDEAEGLRFQFFNRRAQARENGILGAIFGGFMGS